jgi:magnesium transporter
MPKLGKEFAVALFNGLVCSIILLSYSFIINSPHNLSYTVSIALVSAILFASLFGMLVPLLLDKFKIDPALATGPFITTSNDLLALGLYFAIGSVML